MSAIHIIVFLPLLAAIIAGLGNKRWAMFPPRWSRPARCSSRARCRGRSSCRSCRAMPSACLAGAALGDLGRSRFAWALRVDTLTAVMLVVITSVSALVHLYSWGYMSDEPDQPRFFAYLSLFTFAMLMLVTADNLVQMFFGWEGVGLASYLLIGFWFRKPSANAAAIKAFVVNRVGDRLHDGHLRHLPGVRHGFHPAILEAAPGMAGSTIGFLGHRFDTMTVLCLLLFIGAMGKSAQLGLHTWLPDAMEGPTPVSALIHAATMVTAGVFMVCRLSPMFETSPTALGFVTFIGAATCFFAATSARRRPTSSASSPIRPVRSWATCSSRRASAPMARRCSTCSRTPSSRRCCSWARAR
jgi:NADH-quinone oxidoreductase subunit L